jgi:hypothetical protein
MLPTKQGQCDFGGVVKTRTFLELGFKPITRPTLPNAFLTLDPSPLRRPPLSISVSCPVEYGQGRKYNCKIAAKAKNGRGCPLSQKNPLAFNTHNEFTSFTQHFFMQTIKRTTNSLLLAAGPQAK